ncbi:MAG: M16 family metallopeptidase [Nitrospinota bacterium]
MSSNISKLGHKSSNVILERAKDRNSLLIGITIKAGSRNDPSDKNGLFHLMEHLAFKGSEKFSSKEIAIKIDQLAGSLEAFTTRDCSSFRAMVLEDQLEMAFDLLSQIVFKANYFESDIATEKEVVLEEIKMCADSPEDLLYDYIYATLWPDGSFGKSITGTEQSLSAIKREDLIASRAQYYGKENIIITAIGDFLDNRLEDLADNLLSSLPFHAKTSDHQINKPESIEPVVINKNLEQVHVAFAMYGLKAGDNRNYSLNILNNILGGGLASRLFRKIREELALSYSIASMTESYSDCGLFVIYAAVAPQKLDRLINELYNQLSIFTELGPTEEEIDRAVKIEKDAIRIGEDFIEYRMESLINNKFYLDKIVSYEEELAQYDKVSTDSVTELAKEILDLNKLRAVILGPVTEKEIVKLIKS